VTLFFGIAAAACWIPAHRYLLPRHMLMVFAPLGAYFFFTGPGRFSLDAALARRKAEI